MVRLKRTPKLSVEGKSLDKLTVQELRKKVKQKQLERSPPYSKMKKNELINYLHSNQLKTRKQRREDINKKIGINLNTSNSWKIPSTSSRKRSKSSSKRSSKRSSRKKSTSQKGVCSN